MDCGARVKEESRLKSDGTEKKIIKIEPSARENREGRMITTRSKPLTVCSRRRRGTKGRRTVSRSLAWEV